MKILQNCFGTRMLAPALLVALLCSCAQMPLSTADPDFSTGYEEGRITAREDAAGYRCFRARRNFEGSIHLMKYEDVLVGEQRSDAYIQGFRMGFRRFFDYYVDLHCPDLSIWP